MICKGIKIVSLILVLSLPTFGWAQAEGNLSEVGECLVSEEDSTAGVRIAAANISTCIPSEILNMLLDEPQFQVVNTQNICNFPNDTIDFRPCPIYQWFTVLTPSELGFRFNQDDFTSRTIYTREDLQRMNRY